MLLNNEELLEPGRLQAGFEFRDSLRRLRQGLGWYTSLDLESFQENDWNLDTRLETDFSRSRGRGSWQLGIEYRQGRVPIGEFFFAEEDYVGFRLWMVP